ncbi:MAG: hypothetical protein QXP20_01550 [Candidatus Bathyarchaeia archaeon]
MSDQGETITLLVERFGVRFSEQLGINLNGGREGEVFKWFVAALLFGARIPEKIAVNTYRQFKRDNLLTPNKILEAGWDNLVRSLDLGGYVRYDFKTADKFLEVMNNLKSKYNGSLNVLHAKASDPRDLEKCLMELGKGVGEVTVNIFLRELRGIWPKAKPLPQDLVITAAKNLGFTSSAGITPEERANVLEDLEKVWTNNKMVGKGFVDFETGLLRLGKDFCRKGKCQKCPLKTCCIKFIK